MLKGNFVFRRLLVLALCVVSTAASAQRVLTVPDFTTFTNYDLGRPNEIDIQFLPLPDGGTLLYGRFEVWFDGLRFRNLLKLRADGEPDTSWRAEVVAPRMSQFGNLFDVSAINRAVATPSGIAVSGTIERLSGIAVNGLAYLSLVDGRLLRQPEFVGLDGQPSVIDYDAATGYVYVKNAVGDMRRFEAPSGVIDLVWSLQTGTALSSGTKTVETYPTTDGKGGLWVGLSDSSLGFREHELRRIALEPQSSGAFNFRTAALGSKFSISGRFLYPAERKIRLRVEDASTDLSWTPAGFTLFADKNYVYLSDFAEPATLSRASVSGAGATDSWGFSLPAAYRLAELRRVLPWSTSISPDGVALVTVKNTYNADGTLSTIRNALMVKDDPAGNVAPTVIEYYAPAARRYFITGRKAEQDALDALPASFTRTGMRFAAKSSRYRDIPEQPVCRLYAAPDKGGSNSHFYGIGDDCPTLNKLSGLKYEGFDFSVLKPTSSGCAADAPNAVTRLFNNKSATNEGNHRYVVSAVTKAKMLTQGWIDEGAVFCSASVTDAVN
ncbi:MAG: hypothetical protein ABIZ64_00980 [Casimicrobium sp.]